MLGLIVEIAHYQQLKMVEPDLVENLSGELAAAIESQGGRLDSREFGIFSMSVGTDALPPARRVIDFLLGLLRILERRREVLFGFAGYADIFPRSQDRSSAYDLLKACHRRSVADEAILLGRRLADFLGQEVVLEELGNGSRLVGRRESTERHPGSFRDFLPRPELEKKLAGLFVEEALSRRSRPVVVRGGEMPELRRLSLRALNEAFGSENAVRIARPWNPAAPLEPFLAAMAGRFADRAAGFLSGVEKSLWEAKKSLLDIFLRGDGGFDPALCEVEIVSLFLLFISAYTSYCEQELCQAVLLVEQPAGAVADGLMRMAVANHERDLLVIFLEDAPGGPAGRFFTVPPILPAEARVAFASYGRPEKLLERLERDAGGGISAVALHRLLCLENGADEIPPAELELRLLEERDPLLREMLQALCLVPPPRRHVLDCFEQAGLSPPRIRRLVDELVELGYLTDVDSLEPYDQRLADTLLGSLSGRDRDGERRLFDFVFDRWLDRSFEREDAVLRLARRNAGPERLLGLFADLVERAVARGDHSRAERLLREIDDGGAPAGSLRRLPGSGALLAALRLELALGRGEQALAGEQYQHFTSAAGAVDEHPYLAEVMLQNTRWACLGGDMKTALEYAKIATIRFQDSGHDAGIARANFELGIIAASGENLFDARDFFGNAFSAAVRCGNRFEQMRSALFGEVAHFVMGNYSRLLEGIEMVLTLSRRLRLAAWEVAALFIKARVLFELGQYDGAETGLEGALTACRAAGIGEPLPVLKAWIGRCMVHSERMGDGARLLLSLSPTAENRLFLAEAAALSADHAGALERVRESISLDGPCEAFLGRPPRWRDGFFADNLVIGRLSGGAVFPRYRTMLAAWCRVKLAQTREAVADYRRCLREERGSENDASNRLYYYWYHDVLPQTRDDEFEDNLTILGKAVKYLQERTGRIDEPSHKSSFLYSNYWNKRLFATARKHYLI